MAYCFIKTNFFLRLLLAWSLFNSVPATPGRYKDKASRLLTVAVAEFQTSDIPRELQVLGKGIPDALITELGRNRTVRIVEREFLEQIRTELKLQSAPEFEEASRAQAGRLLGARVIVSGKVSLAGDNLLVRARIVSAENAELLGEAEAAGPANSILSLQRSLARQVSTKLALQSALAEVAGLEVSEMTISAYKEVERLRQLAKALPLLGLDPARARKKADYVLALSLCDKLLEAYPKLSAARYYRGLFSLHGEDFDLAAQECEIAQTLNPDNLENLLLKGNLLYAANDLKGAAAAFRQVTEEFPDDGRGWYALGRLFLEAGAKLEAIAAYLAAIERSPLILEAETNLQTLLESPEGLALLARLKKNKPEIYPAAAVYYAFWKNEGQRLGELAETTMEQFPNLYMGYFMQGLLARDRQQNEEAATLFQTCLELRPSFPEVHRELGLLNLDNGRCTEGEQHITLYVQTANFVDDYAELERQIQRCQKRR